MLNKKVLLLPLMFSSAASFAYEVNPGRGYVDYVATAESGDFEADAGKLNDQYWIIENENGIGGCFLRTVELDLSGEPTIFKLKPSINIQGRVRVDNPGQVNTKLLKVKLRYRLKNHTRTTTQSFELTSGQFEQLYDDPQAGWTRTTLGWQDFTWAGVEVAGPVETATLEVCDAASDQRLQISELKLTVLPQK